MSLPPHAHASAIGVLRDGVRLRVGERVLVRGANGGVGTAAVQVARALGQVTALASARHRSLQTSGGFGKRVIQVIPEP